MTSFFNALPGAVAQGLIWGIMAIGVYITYKLLDIADLTVDGSLIFTEHSVKACGEKLLSEWRLYIWLGLLGILSLWQSSLGL